VLRAAARSSVKRGTADATGQTSAAGGSGVADAAARSRGSYWLLGEEEGGMIRSGCS